MVSVSGRTRTSQVQGVVFNGARTDKAADNVLAGIRHADLAEWKGLPWPVKPLGPVQSYVAPSSRLDSKLSSSPSHSVLSSTWTT